MHQYLIFFFVILSSLIHAQKQYPVEIGAGFDITTYGGDLSNTEDELNIKNIGFAFSAYLRRNMGNNLALRMNIMAGQLKGDDKSYDKPEWRHTRGISFISPFVEISVLGEVYPFGLYKKHADTDNFGVSDKQAIQSRRRIIPYIMTGIGAASRNPTVEWNENDDNGVTSVSMRQLDKSARARGISFVVPFGGGIRFAINDRLNLELEAVLRPTFNDYLDGVSQRGNPDVNDWFFTGGLTLSHAISDNDDKKSIPPAPAFAQKREDKQVVTDRDKDGIIDDKDACPDQPGFQSVDGYPDNDSDGIADKDDNCPEQAGKPDLAGCPDTDGDGIADKDDGCPTVAGIAVNLGCPQVALSSPDLPHRSVYFGTSKIIWHKSYYTVMDEVAITLKSDPKLLARIEGHADNTGKGITNFLISERRAENCYNYLVSKGISASRLRYVAFGSDRPATSNDNQQGRRLNRRVDIYFTY